eukprot:373163-Rhodomonas_salina.2
MQGPRRQIREAGHCGYALFFVLDLHARCAMSGADTSCVASRCVLTCAAEPGSDERSARRVGIVRADAFASQHGDDAASSKHAPRQHLGCPLRPEHQSKQAQ